MFLSTSNKNFKVMKSNLTNIKFTNFSSGTFSEKSQKSENKNPVFVGEFGIDCLSKAFPSAIFYTINGESVVKIPSVNLVPFLTFLKRHTSTNMNQLMDISAIDCPERKFRFEVIYQFLSITYNQRLTVSVSITEGTTLESVTSIYPSAGWYERETWDRFGICFQKHSDFRRRLTDYGFKGHPLRKDFPVTGFIEVRYNDFRKRILYEKVSLPQEYRQYSLDNSWKN